MGDCHSFEPTKAAELYVAAFLRPPEKHILRRPYSVSVRLTCQLRQIGDRVTVSVQNRGHEVDVRLVRILRTSSLAHEGDVAVPPEDSV